MKKILKKIILVGIVAITIYYGINQSKSEAELSDLLLDNVEALAYNELTSSGWRCFKYLYDDYNVNYYMIVTRCFDCHSSSALSAWTTSYCWFK